MISSVKKAQVVMGVPQGGEAQSIYIGSSPEEATEQYKKLASAGKSDKYTTLIWYGNGRLIKSCKLSPVAKTKAKKSETNEQSE
jgi:hypothetical protein